MIPPNRIRHSPVRYGAKYIQEGKRYTAGKIKNNRYKKDQEKKERWRKDENRYKVQRGEPIIPAVNKGDFHEWMHRPPVLRPEPGIQTERINLVRNR